MDIAERLTGRGLFRALERDTAALDDRATVQRWLREWRPDRDQQVFVHRPWGTVVAVADGRLPISVFMSDGDKSWFAVAPGAPDDQELTPEQVEHVLLDALTSTGPPTWPEWRYLI